VAVPSVEIWSPGESGERIGRGISMFAVVKKRDP